MMEKERRIYNFYNDSICNYLSDNKKYKEVLQNEEQLEILEKPLFETETKIQDLTSKEIKTTTTTKLPETVAELSAYLGTDLMEDFIMELDETEEEELLPNLMDTFDESEFNVTLLSKLLSGYEMSASDLFIQKSKRLRPWNKRINYVLWKLETLPTFEFYYNRNLMVKNLSSKYTTLPSLLNSLEYYLKNYDNTLNTFCLYHLYELLCNTYIVSKQEKSRFTV